MRRLGENQGKKESSSNIKTIIFLRKLSLRILGQNSTLKFLTQQNLSDISLKIMSLIYVEFPTPPQSKLPLPFVVDSVANLIHFSCNYTSPWTTARLN